MASKFITGQYLEWSTLLPTSGRPRESPVFLLGSNEWIFRFVLEDWFYRLHLDAVKVKTTDIKPFFVKFQIGFENEKSSGFAPICINLHQGELRISKRQAVCAIPIEKIESNLPREYMNGEWLKFQFCFKNLNEPLLFIRKETEKDPEGISECQDWQIPSDSKYNHLTALSRDFSKLLDKSTDYDVEIKCEGSIFQAHRSILGARSDVFDAIIKSNNMVEGKMSVIEVEGMKSSVFQMFLLYLYTGTLPDLDVATAKQFYEAADRYAVEELQISCSKVLLKKLSPSNAGDILLFADQHKDLDFQRKVMSYIIDNDFPDYDIFWADFLKNHAELAAELFNLYRLKYS